MCVCVYRMCADDCDSKTITNYELEWFNYYGYST